MTLSSEERERLISALHQGAPFEIAHRALGITSERFEALVVGDDELREAIERARAESEVANLVLISRQARNGNWLAAAWLLERLHPERYARPAVRQEERASQLSSSSDRLDDLADKRAARRARSSS